MEKIENADLSETITEWGYLKKKPLIGVTLLLHHFPVDFPFTVYFSELQFLVALAFKQVGAVILCERRGRLIIVARDLQVVNADIDVFAAFAHFNFMINPLIQVHALRTETGSIKSSVNGHITGFPAFCPLRNQIAQSSFGC